MIKYDHERFEKFMGRPMKKLTEELDIMTARAILDIVDRDDDEKHFSNAVHWIRSAYRKGIRDGKEAQDKDYGQKIKKIFGLE